MSYFSQKILFTSNLCLQNARAVFTYAFDGNKKGIVSCCTVGRFSQSEFLASVDKCKQVSEYVFDYYREMIKRFGNTM